MNPHSLVYAVAAILLGVVGIVFHDFAMQWQPVPAGIGMRTQLAYVAARCSSSGALLLVRDERAGAWLLTSSSAVDARAQPAAAIASAIAHRRVEQSRRDRVPDLGRLGAVAAASRAAPAEAASRRALLAGASAMVFGFAHFNYIDFTASMVPGWIPVKTSGPGPRARASRRGPRC
jgi:uncharacterized membrane protein